jgi:phosphatidylserine decarboxylase
MDGASAAVRYRDRESGAVVEERVFGGDALRLLYGDRRARLFTDHLLTREPLNHVYGWLQRSPRSRRRIASFVAALGIDPSEAERPLAEYDSLDAFFTRRLKPGARPIDREPDHLVSPADGRVLAIPRLEGGRLSVKRCSIGLAELVGDADLAARYLGGAALIVRLAPADYHRFHFPETGLASPSRPAGRGLHSVHPIALAAGAPSFRNKRMVSSVETERFGKLLLVEVGALLVGTIVQTYRPGRVERGAEKGYFRFGGSTVILAIEPGRARVDEDLVAASADGLETYVKMGTRIARRAGA